jgi:hypothetical protein
MQDAMNSYGEMEVQLQVFFALTLNGGEWSVSRPDRFTSGERDAGTNFTEGWVYPTTGLDVVAKRNISLPAGNRTLVTSVTIMGELTASILLGNRCQNVLPSAHFKGHFT